MIRLTCVLVSLYLIILCAPGAFGDERVYDFSNDDAWEPIQAEWEIVDGEFVVTRLKVYLITPMYSALPESDVLKSTMEWPSEAPLCALYLALRQSGLV